MGGDAYHCLVVRLGMKWAREVHERWQFDLDRLRNDRS